MCCASNDLHFEFNPDVNNIGVIPTYMIHIIEEGGVGVDRVNDMFMNIHFVFLYLLYKIY